jgi:hypothetical protein
VRPSPFNVLAVQGLLNRAEALLETGEPSVPLAMVVTALVDREDLLAHLDADTQSRYECVLIAYRELEADRG